GIEHYASALKLRLVVLEILYGYALGREETMPDCGMSDRNGAEIERQDFSVEQRQHAVDRPYPAERRRGKAHRLRPLESEDRRPKKRRQYLDGWFPCAIKEGEIEFTLASVAPHALINRREPHGFEKALYCIFRRSDAWTPALFNDVGLCRGQILNNQHQ